MRDRTTILQRLGVVSMRKTRDAVICDLNIHPGAYVVLSRNGNVFGSSRYVVSVFCATAMHLFRCDCSRWFLVLRRAREFQRAVGDMPPSWAVAMMRRFLPTHWELAWFNGQRRAGGVARMWAERIEIYATDGTDALQLHWILAHEICHALGHVHHDVAFAHALCGLAQCEGLLCYMPSWEYPIVRHIVNGTRALFGYSDGDGI